LYYSDVANKLLQTHALWLATSLMKSSRYRLGRRFSLYIK